MIFAQALYLFAPLLVAIALSAVVHRLDLLRALRYPMDLGIEFRGTRLFGDNKTWRGFVVAVIGSIAGVLLQRYGPGLRFPELAVIDYASVNPIALGFAMGAGSILGELPNSFVKRRLGIHPGQNGTGLIGILFFLWDQLDTLTIAWPLIWYWVRPSWQLVLASFVLVLLLHPFFSVIAYLIGARPRIR